MEDLRFIAKAVNGLKDDAEAIKGRSLGLGDLTKPPDVSTNTLWQTARDLCAMTAYIDLRDRGDTPAVKTCWGKSVLEMMNIVPQRTLWPSQSYDCCAMAEGYLLRNISRGGYPVILTHEGTPVGLLKTAGEETVLGVQDVPEQGIQAGVFSALTSDQTAFNLAQLADGESLPIRASLNELGEGSQYGRPLRVLRMLTFAIDPDILDVFTRAQPEKAPRVGIDEVKQRVTRMLAECPPRTLSRTERRMVRNS